MTADRKRKRRVMATFLAVAFSAGVMPGRAPAEGSSFAIKGGDRVVIYGDSITAGAQFPNSARYLETYLRTRFPDWKIEFWNRGWGGDTAANLARFKRDCLSLKPDVITINWDDAVILTVGPKTYSLALAGSGPMVWPESAGKEGVLFEVKHADGQTIYDAAIPWSAVSADEPTVGAVYRFGLHVCDRDRDESHKSLNLSGASGAPGLGKVKLIGALTQEAGSQARK